MFVDFKDCKYQGKPIKLNRGQRFQDVMQNKYVDATVEDERHSSGEMPLRFKVPSSKLHTSGPSLGAKGVNVALPRDLDPSCDAGQVIEY
eukprot:SAG11_NODE_15683_length_569_cov_2.212766_2_plen_89_part_01